MTAVTQSAERTEFVTRVHARATRRVLRSIAGPTVLLGACAWFTFGVVAVAIPLVVDNAGNQMDDGIVGISEYIARWVAFGTTVAVYATIVANHIAAGGTRRSLRTGAVRSTVVVGLAYGLFAAAAVLGERALFGSLGWAWRPPEGLATGDAVFGVTLLAEGIVVAVYVLVACAVVAGYFSHGVWRGTLLLLPALVLLALSDLATASGSTYDVLGGLNPLTGATAVVVGVIAGLGVVALAAGWLHLRLRTLRLRPAG